MRMQLRRGVTWLAIYAVAMHTLLTGIGPAFASAQDSVDPFSVLCLHDAGAASLDDRQPAGLVPGHTSEHCNFCGVAAPPPAPDIVLIGNLMLTRLQKVLPPVSMAPSTGVAFRPNLARGPPLFV